MSDGFHPYKQICANPKCGHDKSTHYFDEKGAGDCLGVHCDCKGYSTEWAPKTEPSKSSDFWHLSGWFKLP